MSEKRSFLEGLLTMALVVEIYGRRALVAVRPVVLPVMRLGCALAYVGAALLGGLQVLLNSWDALMLVAVGREASVYGAMLAEHEPLGLTGLFVAALYWAPLAYAALCFCLGRILQLTVDCYHRLSRDIHISLL